MDKINYQLITIAREIEGYTQKEFAAAIKIEQGTLSKIENGLIEKISEELINKISYVLNYPISFFYQDWNPLRIEGHYRRKVSESVKAFKENKAKMTLAERHFNILTEHIELPPVNFPTWDVEHDGEVSMCAKYVREFWRVPKGRIDNVTELLEQNGFVIIEIELYETDGFSAFSNSGTPLIFVNKNLPGDRYRLTIMHEAFHFILHHGKKIVPERDIEKESFEGASEFMVPIYEIEHQLTKLSISKLMDLKAYWKMSMQAILYKARHHKLISESQSQYLWRQFSAAGYRKNEPIDIQKERPIIFNEILDTYLQEWKYSNEDLKNLLKFNQIDEWYFNKGIKLKLLKRSL
ncbi:helix-turn-helix domain-containing protein [Mucilaginibacter flavus]|uniref:helix-turn-helix domain-containing protein n=1 Tax=Mucilaginibacter flavus TaxID=931504 RepID=UPI0025B3EF07|nr:ImmA/IrrE family metallo-endopeptidase [Mucilaginibacter flavus]MDN3580367.1 ImmA/IrrE family metallo-endopeptidase [Mucilaginibacter flavus]